jgi:hypothetical protein
VIVAAGAVEVALGPCQPQLLEAEDTVGGVDVEDADRAQAVDHGLVRARAPDLDVLGDVEIALRRVRLVGEVDLADLGAAGDRELEGPGRQDDVPAHDPGLHDRGAQRARAVAGRLALAVAGRRVDCVGRVVDVEDRRRLGGHGEDQHECDEGRGERREHEEPLARSEWWGWSRRRSPGVVMAGASSPGTARPDPLGLVSTTPRNTRLRD